MDTEKIGKFIASLRKEKNLTQEELAIQMYVTRENISKWERGVSLPNAEALLTLSKLFNVSVNEILMGEKKTKDNKENIENITLDVLKNSEHKSKKFMKILTFELIILLFLFLGYYFLSTYKTIFVYRVMGESDNFSIPSGLAVFSKSKSYLKIGQIESLNNFEILEYEIYYDNHLVFKSDDTNYTLISVNQQDDYLPYKDRKKIINDMYIKITYQDNKTETIKLEFQEDLSK